MSDSGKVQKRYIRGNDLVYADKGENTEKQYYVTDPHGNVVQLTDESGKVIKTYEYDSFGNEVKSDGKDDNPFRYCGEYYDKETGEIYLRARYYQPAVGRFLTRDTYTGENDEPLSLHLYTYCENDGVNYIDPEGHKKRAIILVGADNASNNNAFYDDATTWKTDHKNYKVTIYRGWKYKSLNKLWKKINKKTNKLVSQLIIMAHSDFQKILLSSSYYVNSNPDNIINKDTDLSMITSCLKKSAKIYIHGCNAGGMAGHKNADITYLAANNQNGEMKRGNSIAQIIANKTKKTTYAYVNGTRQVTIGTKHYQKPTDPYGEASGMAFDLYNKKGHFVKVIKGRKVTKFTKFKPQ